MQIGKFLFRWIEVLAALATDWRSAWQARKSVVVTRQEGCFVLRRSGTKGDDVVTNVPIGAQLPRETAEAWRNRFILFELAAEMIVTRRLTVPARAQEFLPGIVRNQIERLSPWPLAQAAYGFNATLSRDDADILDVRVMIVSRATIAGICDELKASGLSPDRIIAPIESGNKTTPVTLWTRPTHGPHQSLQSLPRMIGTGLAAVVFSSLAISVWALDAASSAWTDYEETSARVTDLQRDDQALRKPQAIASLKPAERAWALKESSPAAVLTLEALARALPDSAYLTELRLENATLRIVGLATDAPSLIAALEQSKRFSAVHFFAPTTKDPDGGRYRFYIEARVEDHFVLIGD